MFSLRASVSCLTITTLEIEMGRDIVANCQSQGSSTRKNSNCEQTELTRKLLRSKNGKLRKKTTEVAPFWPLKRINHVHVLYLLVEILMFLLDSPGGVKEAPGLRGAAGAGHLLSSTHEAVVQDT